MYNPNNKECQSNNHGCKLDHQHYVGCAGPVICTCPTHDEENRACDKNMLIGENIQCTCGDTVLHNYANGEIPNPEQKEEWENKYTCPNTGCDNNGTVAVQIGENEWEAQQCQYCFEIWFPLRDAIRSQIALARQQERENMSTFLKEDEEHINALIRLTESRAREEIKELLVEQIKVAIFAQEQHIKGLSQVGGFWETIQERAFKFDQLEGQKQILRFIEKGYFPALTEKV